MPELDFDLHAWPGYPEPAIASAVRQAATSAAGGGSAVVGVRVAAKSPFAARVSVAVTANLSGVVARAVEATIVRLGDPTEPYAGACR